MNARTAVSFSIIMALTMLSFAMANSAAAGALPTAKTRLAAATAEARKWQPDGVLVLVETSTAEPDGRA